MDASTDVVTLSSVTTEVRRQGEGRTLLMIQGAGTSKAAWDPIVERLADGVRCVTYDNRGVGNASDVGESLSIDDLAGDAAELIGVLGEGPVHVCGVSLGGMIAMTLAARHPELVLSLGLHSTTPRLDRRVLDVNEFRLRIVDLELPAEVLRGFVGLWSPGAAGWRVELPAAVVNTESFSRHNYVWHMRAAMGHEMSEQELAAISCPTLITVGSDDILTTPDNARTLHRAIPGSKMVTVDGGGHGYYIEEPDLVAALQRGWIDQHS